MIDRAEEATASWNPQADELKEMALQYAAVAQERLAEGSERVKEYVVKQPTRALGIALGLGVLLGWMIKRR
ncbi:MAG: DUF883 C-terminal domain-containing protein [Isosphaeraceae bacterium]|nr:DUF883 C-terminal domain-containing protein [Isosphaeraceae bacterium]